jgi:S1-C subfamily serine protease
MTSALLVILLAPLVNASPATVPAEQGLAVEEVAPESAAARAGIAPGDLLQS